MEWKIGEIFEHNGEWYQCVKGDCCRNCDFYDKFKDDICFLINNCSLSHRSDKTSVIFKKLEKVGEPIARAKRPKGANDWGWFPYAEFQKYKVSFPVILPKEPFTHLDEDKGIVYIEIKEDMKEKKTNFREADTPLTRLVGRYVNNLIDYDTFKKTVKELYSNDFGSEQELKPFSLELAKAGKPVCTRDGRKTRVLCYDFKQNEEYPILVSVENKDGKECALLYSNDGISEMYKSSNNELVMFPEKKEGWVNVYKRGNEYVCENECNVFTGITVFKSEGEAKRNIDKNKIYVNTIKISWEE